MTIEEQLHESLAASVSLAVERDDLRATVEKLTVGAADELNSAKIDIAAKDVRLGELTAAVDGLSAEVVTLKATLAALPDTTPPLLLSNNDVEAKRAFLERVGYAAVVPRVHEQFVKGVAPLKVASVTTAPLPAPARPAPAFDPNLSRNAPCPCGSGQRYKHCHGANL